MNEKCNLSFSQLQTQIQTLVVLKRKAIIHVTLNWKYT